MAHGTQGIVQHNGSGMVSRAAPKGLHQPNLQQLDTSDIRCTTRKCSGRTAFPHLYRWPRQHYNQQNIQIRWWHKQWKNCREQCLKMHIKKALMTIIGTVRKESDDLVILGVTFGSKLTFEKHLCLVSRAASRFLEQTWYLEEAWRVFHYRSLLERCFRDFVRPVLEYCSAMWCSAADTHLKLQDRAVRSACFLTGDVFECGIAHRWSVAVLCMLYK